MWCQSLCNSWTHTSSRKGPVSICTSILLDDTPVSARTMPQRNHWFHLNRPASLSGKREYVSIIAHISRCNSPAQPAMVSKPTKLPSAMVCCLSWWVTHAPFYLHPSRLFTPRKRKKELMLLFARIQGLQTGKVPLFCRLVFVLWFEEATYRIAVVEASRLSQWETAAKT